MANVPTISRVPLENRWIQLEPLTAGHTAELDAAADDPDEVFRWVYGWRPGPDGLRASVETALAQNEAGTYVTWAIRRRLDGTLVGATSYLDIDAANRRVEVGATWIGRAWWRTEVNTATKLLVLGHGFDTLGLERIALKTDHLNLRSQRAIERLGGRYEGALRHHILRPDGTWRDTVYYSILSAEWPEVRDRLAAALTREAGRS